MPGPKGERRGFGVLVGELRDSVAETQAQFAKRLCCSRELVAALEGGHKPPSKEVLALLIHNFRGEKQAIEEAARLHRKPRRPHRPSGLDPFFSEAESLAIFGKDQEAWDLLMEKAKTVSDPYQIGWLMVRLAHLAYFSDVIAPEPREPFYYLPARFLDKASILARQLTTANPDKKVIELWDEIIYSYSLVEWPEIASGRLTEALRRYPKAGLLWYRMATMHFEEGRFALAYAAVNAALRHKVHRYDGLQLRGEILAEWGDPAEAIRDLDEALLNVRISHSQRAELRSIRGFALFRRGRVFEAISELVEVVDRREPLPNYFLAKCFELLASEALVMGDNDKATDLESEALKRFEMSGERVLFPWRRSRYADLRTWDSAQRNLDRGLAAYESMR